MTDIDIYATINGINYKPRLCRDLKTFDFDDLGEALRKEASFLLNANKNKIAVSWWVSPKRTRSYPYARVYDTLCFVGKKITIIPIVKDEGKDGDRDFLQWDTVSLMSLLDIYTIITYYIDAEKNPKFKNKITKQNFDLNHIKSEINKLLTFQSNALDWNLSQLEHVGEIGERALEGYQKIANKLGVEMHSRDLAVIRIEELKKSMESFKNLSRDLAEKAQKRERVTIQPKENIKGVKGTLTIKNNLGGYYYFTCDEVEFHGNQVYLIEAKHSKLKELPSDEDIKDGLLRMVLYTNLKTLEINGKMYEPVPVLKLTTAKNVNADFLKRSKTFIELLKESKENGFKVMLNNETVNNE